jgi:hypothetical protein
VHPETRALFLSGSPEEVLICDGALDPKIAVLEQPVRLDVFAGKVSEILETQCFEGEAENPSPKGYARDLQIEVEK